MASVNTESRSAANMGTNSQFPSRIVDADVGNVSSIGGSGDCWSSRGGRAAFEHAEKLLLLLSTIG